MPESPANNRPGKLGAQVTTLFPSPTAFKTSSWYHLHVTKLQASPLHSHKILESGHLCQGEGRYITSWTGGTRTVDNRRMCMEELTRGNKPQAATSSHQQPQDRGVQEHSAVPAPARSPDHPNAPCWAAEEAYSQQGFGGSCLQHQKPDWLDHLQAALQYKQNINLKKCSFYLLHFGGKKKIFSLQKEDWDASAWNRKLSLQYSSNNQSPNTTE